jgi:hypothetical protein
MNTITTFFRGHRALTAATAVIGVVLIGLLFTYVANAPDSSGVRVSSCIESDGGACIKFPAVTGTNLLGTAYNLPQDFAGAYNLVVISFDEAQTVRAEGWLPLARELAGQVPDFAYYSLPTLKAMTPLVRGIITGGMNVVIPDENLREITIMLFLDDLDAFLSGLSINDTSQLHLFLLNAAGEVVWQASGDYSDTTGKDLRAAVDGLE